MSEKVLGFKEKGDVWKDLKTGGKEDAYFFYERSKVPVVSVEEHKKRIKGWQDRCDFWIGKVRFYEYCCNKTTFEDISGRKFVSVEFLKDWCKGNQFGFRPPRVNVEELLKAVRLQAKKEAKKK